MPLIGCVDRAVSVCPGRASRIRMPERRSSLPVAVPNAASAAFDAE